MADLLALSSRFIDEGVFEGPGSVNRITTELSEVADGIAVVEAFSHVVAFATDEGLLLFDTSLEVFAPAILKSLRGWSAQPVHSIVYTHGHVDHVGGAAAVLDEARQRGGRGRRSWGTRTCQSGSRATSGPAATTCASTSASSGAAAWLRGNVRGSVRASASGRRGSARRR